MEDSLLDTSNQSYLDESVLSSSFAHNETDANISDILTLNENENENNLWTQGKSESRTASPSGSPTMDDVVPKRKVKKYAMEADLKLVKLFDEIKPKLAHQVK